MLFRSVWDFNGGLGDYPRGLFCRSLFGDRRLPLGTNSRVFSGRLQIVDPAQKRREVSYIGDVPKLLGGVPTGSKCFHRILLGEGRYQINSHTVNYRCGLYAQTLGCPLHPVPNRHENSTPWQSIRKPPRVLEIWCLGIGVLHCSISKSQSAVVMYSI